MNLIHLLFFKGSRKVGFGLWLFIVSNTYLVMKLIDANYWFTCICLTSALVGGGTIADRFIEAKKATPKE